MVSPSLKGESIRLELLYASTMGQNHERFYLFFDRILIDFLMDFLMDFSMDFTSSGSSELGRDLQKNVFFFFVFVRVLGVPSWAKTSRKMVIVVVVVVIAAVVAVVVVVVW